VSEFWRRLPALAKSR